MSSVTKTKKRSLPSQRETPKIQADFFNASNSGILPKKIQDSTHPTSFLPQSFNCSKIASLIKQQRLTDAIEHIEKLGYTRDTAILLLAKFQAFGGVA